MKMKEVLKITATALTVMSAASVTTGPVWAADDELTIGFAIAQSGFLAGYDAAPLVGAQIAIDDINAKGGLLGKKVKYVITDTKSDQTEGARAGQEVIANGAKFMIVSCDYDFGSGAATVANANDMIALGCAADAKFGVQGIGPDAFSMANSALSMGASLAEWAWTKKGWRNAYQLLDTSIEYDKAVCRGFKTRWQKLGGQLLGEDSFKQDDASIDSQITRIQSTARDKGNIDFMMLCSYGAGSIKATRALRGAGVNVPIGSGDATDGDYWAKGIPNLNDFYTAADGSPFGDDPRPKVNAFMAQTAGKNGGKPLPISFGMCGYSQIEAIALGITRAKSTETNKVVDEMNKFKNEDFLMGPTSYSPDLHINLQRPMAILGIKDSKGYFVDMVQLSESPQIEMNFKK